MSPSQRRMRCFAGPSLACSSLRARLDRAFRHLAGPAATLCREPSMAVIPSVFGTGSGIDRETLAAARYDIVTARRESGYSRSKRGLPLKKSLNQHRPAIGFKAGRRVQSGQCDARIEPTPGGNASMNS
jgi:hypothetical protein